MVYNEIYNFCSVRNTNGAAQNGTTNVPNRIQFILSLLEKENIPYEVDRFVDKQFKNNFFYNIILRGSDDATRMVMAHHDVCNPTIDNANDNSCSVINAIAIKKLRPNIHVVLVDGEEPPCMGVGSNHLSAQIKNGEFGNIEWVLNLELTGKGGKNFFIGDHQNSRLRQHIINIFDCPSIPTPFNDASILHRNGIDSIVINPCPILSPVVEDANNEPQITFDDLMALFSPQDERRFHTLRMKYGRNSFGSRSSMFSAIDMEDDMDYFDDEANFTDMEKNPAEIEELKSLTERYKRFEETYRKFAKQRGNTFQRNVVYKGNNLDLSLLSNCHSSRDTVDTIDPTDMKEFVEEVVLTILDTPMV